MGAGAQCTPKGTLLKTEKSSDLGNSFSGGALFNLLKKKIERVAPAKDTINYTPKIRLLSPWWPQRNKLRLAGWSRGDGT